MATSKKPKAKDKTPAKSSPKGSADVDITKDQATESGAEIQAAEKVAQENPANPVSDDKAPGLTENPEPVEPETEKPAETEGGQPEDDQEDNPVTTDKKDISLKGMKAVSSWAMEKGLASWQTAMLNKASGWTEDKKVSEDDFNTAMAKHLNRPQGGAHGRRN